MSQAYIPPQDAQYGGGVYQASPFQGDYEAGKLQNDEIARIDRGCFKFYQILLIVVPILGLGAAVRAVNIPYIIMYAYLLAFCILQYQAIQAKNLAKVSEATQGLKMYVLMVILAVAANTIMDPNNLIGALIYGLIEMAVFFITILMGSMEVESILKKHASLQNE